MRANVACEQVLLWVSHTSGGAAKANDKAARYLQAYSGLLLLYRRVKQELQKPDAHAGYAFAGLFVCQAAQAKGACSACRAYIK